MFGDAGEFGIFLDDTFDGAGGEATKIARDVGRSLIFAVVEEEGNERIGAGGEIILDAVGGGFGDEDGAVFVAFATDHELATFKVDRITVEFDNFGNS